MGAGCTTGRGDFMRKNIGHFKNAIMQEAGKLPCKMNKKMKYLFF
jgi:hypothetical protein